MLLVSLGGRSLKMFPSAFTAYFILCKNVLAVIIKMCMMQTYGGGGERDYVFWIWGFISLTSTDVVGP